MRKRYHIEISTNEQQIVFCPEDMITKKSPRKIAFGSNLIDVDFRSYPDKTDRIAISKTIQEKLQFPNFNIPLNVFLEDQILSIGPLVGIFTAGFTEGEENIIGERTEFFAKLLSVKKCVGALPFVFGEQHIDWETGTIDGYFFQNKCWQKLTVPFPNVIYDRLPNRRIENNPRLLRVKKRLQKEYLIPWYNPGFFNKLDIYERLEQDDTVTCYLPETHPMQSFSMIETMLSKYGHVYIKPKNGSLGLGVHQLVYEKHENKYYCRYQDRDGQNRLQRFSSLEKLFQVVFSSQDLSKMIVQQGIHLLRLNSRQVDFRVHTNKDDAGQWHVSALAAKIAGPGSVTTHKRNGGEIKTLADLFPEVDCTLYSEKLSNAALLLSNALDRYAEGIIGEIGFDLGVDKAGRVWLFEANSKPGRSIFDHPGMEKFDLLTRKLSIAFAIYLTEQAILHPEEVFK